MISPHGLGGVRLFLFAVLSSMTFQRVQAQSNFAIGWSSVGGGGGTCTGVVYSVSSKIGVADSYLMRSASYIVTGNFGSGTIVLPDGFYIGIDMLNPAQALADFDGDGISNLMEFGLGTDPRNPADSARVLLISVTTIGGNQFVTMQFKRRINAAALGLQYLPEVSADGQTWYSDTGHVLEIDATALDPQFDWVTIQDRTPATGGVPRFARLRLIEN